MNMKPLLVMIKRKNQDLAEKLAVERLRCFNSNMLISLEHEFRGALHIIKIGTRRYICAVIFFPLEQHEGRVERYSGSLTLAILETLR